jgi:hypothetical protein
MWDPSEPALPEQLADDHRRLGIRTFTSVVSTRPSAGAMPNSAKQLEVATSH